MTTPHARRTLSRETLATLGDDAVNPPVAFAVLNDVHSALMVAEDILLGLPTVEGYEGITIESEDAQIIAKAIEERVARGRPIMAWWTCEGAEAIAKSIAQGRATTVRASDVTAAVRVHLDSDDDVEWYTDDDVREIAAHTGAHLYRLTIWCQQRCACDLFDAAGWDPDSFPKMLLGT
jgi:hypothetical protein